MTPKRPSVGRCGFLRLDRKAASDIKTLADVEALLDGPRHAMTGEALSAAYAVLKAAMERAGQWPPVKVERAPKGR